MNSVAARQWHSTSQSAFWQLFVGSFRPDRTPMGYDLRITRAIDWTANRGVEISTPEWMAVVAADPELTVDPENGPFCARFGAAGWFDWFEGNVFTTDPDHATVKKMLAIAQQLAATVQGDDGEFYDSANQWTRGRTGSSSSGGGAK